MHDDPRRQGIQAEQRRGLAALLVALRTNPFYRRKLDGLAFDPQCDPIAALPFTTREEIQRDQLEHPPYGTNLTYPLDRYVRLHQTSGSTGTPLRWLDTAESWEWWKRCWGRVYDGAGLGPGDRAVFTFSFGPFIGFWSAFDAAIERGLLCLAAGGLSSTARLRYMLDNAATVLVCTPTYALHLAEVARAEGVDLPGSAVRAVIVAGEPGGNIPATRSAIEVAWGARVLDHAGMTEVGAWGFETRAAPGGMFINEREFIAEVVDPRSRAPVAPGAVGELVLTNLGRLGSPLVRYLTGDLVRLSAREVEGGDGFLWAEGGVLGRVDDMLFIRGINVFPSAIEGILRGVSGVAEFRIEVTRRESLSELCIDVEPSADCDAASLVERVTHALRDRLNFRPSVRLAAIGTLPRFELKARRIVRRTGLDA